MTSAQAILRRIVASIDDEKLGAYGVHLLVGSEQAEHRWRSDDRVNLYSVSKGVSALAAGIAVDAGLLTLNSKVGELLPEMHLGNGVDQVALHHLLTMTSGIDFEWWSFDEASWPDLAQEMLRRPTRGAGTVFQYSDVSTYVAMRMLGAVVGDVRDWLLPRLFEPLGIHNPQWNRCPNGWIIGAAGLHLRTEELARIGRMLRDGGVWGNHRIVSSSWVNAMASDWVTTGRETDWADYSLATWRGPATGWRLDGLYGQYVYVDAQHDAVVTITAHEEERDHRLVEIAAAALIT